MTSTDVNDRPVSERDAADERRLVYRRARHAFVGGSRRGSLLDERRRNRPLLAGLAVAVVAVVVAGAVGLFSDRPPEGWDRDGTVLVVADTGERFVVVHHTRRPVVNETSLRLVLGTTGRRVTVSRSRAHMLREAPPLGEPAWPFTAPQLVEPTTAVAACARGDQPLQVLVGAPVPAPTESFLVSTAGTAWLVSGGRRFRIADSVTGAGLGYDTAAATAVPAGWLTLLPEGPPLERLILPPAVPLPPGTPPFLADGTLVADGGSSRLFVASQGTLRPLLTNTAVRLLFGVTAPPAPVTVPPDVIRTVPQGAPVGADGQPDTPPPASGAGDRWLCARDPGGVAALADLPTQGLQGSNGNNTAPGGSAVVWLPAGRGMLVAPPGGGSDSRSLVAGNNRFAASPDVLGALGYDPAAARSVPAPLIDAIAPGPPLRRLQL